MSKLLYALVLVGLGECLADSKSGFFIEAGFMTGMLKSSEVLAKKQRATSFISTAQLKAHALTMFNSTDKVIKNPKRDFNTLSPIKISLKDKTLTLQNFLPYTLHNVDLYANINGKEVKVGTLESLPGHIETTLSVNLLPEIAKVENNLGSEFLIRSSAQSDVITHRVLEAIEQIKVNLMGTFVDWSNGDKTNNWQPPTPKQASEYVDLLLNLTSVLSSKEFEEAILNAPFDFSDRTPPGQNGRLDPSKLGAVASKIDPQVVVDVFRQAAHLDLGVINEKKYNLYGLGGVGSFGLQPWMIDPSRARMWKTYDTLTKEREHEPLEAIIHEFAHTKNYTHNGNMTYANAPNSQYTIDNQKVDAGFVRLTEKVWAQLGHANKLPINYTEIPISHTINSVPYASFMQGFSNTLNNQSTDAIVGFNVKSGYQQFFNPYFGLAYYALFKYGWTKTKGYAKTVTQMGAGVGADMLVNFFANDKASMGIFVGARGLWNRYNLLRTFRDTGNVNAVSGFNYYYGRSKYSFGVSVPLIQRNLKVRVNTQDYAGEVLIQEGSTHFNVFFNYGFSL
ncbi:outer membrane beta-barrel protein [Helicobacter sp. NHP22-001]|uniref:outer membrane beta-barrel protein n=1 Tax=Helicobacter sp. NHP22-001 TaxID=3040202 RepID=UPI002556EF46|nr:outer membrane beta-barrel protein [Helicobacter sp. NHP22-001]